MKYIAAAIAGAAAGAFLIWFGFNFRLGAWWAAAPEAYAPAAISGALIGAAVLWAYERAGGRLFS